MSYEDLHLFLSIAEIAGVFIGFGALISATGEQSVAARSKLLTAAYIGIGVLIAALFPVWLARFGVSGQALWKSASAVGLVLIWVILWIAFRDPEYREWNRRDARENPVWAVFYFVCLEVPIQMSLVLVILGVAPTLAPAFYTTALILNLFEAATMLARYVFSKDTRQVG